MVTVQISDDLFKVAQNLAAQKAVSVDEIIEETLSTFFQDQTSDVEEQTPGVYPFDHEFDTAYHVAKSRIARYQGLLLSLRLEEQGKPNPNQDIIANLKAGEEKHKGAGWDLLSKTTEELNSLIDKYGDLANEIRASRV